MTPHLLYRLRAWLTWRLRARGLHGLHSPFVYEFATQVLRGPASSLGASFEAFRRVLLKEEIPMLIADYGAGYDGDGREQRTVPLSAVAKGSARRRRTGEVLHRICRHYQPKVCLELGTNLGLSTLYQLSALEDSRFMTVEGSQSLANMATKFFLRFKLQPELVVTTFDEYLSRPELPQRLDYVFLDGHHTYADTLRYVRALEPRFGPGSILVLDDIHWSPEMGRAWDEICQWPTAVVTIDLFQLGVVFWHRKQAKEHFALRF